MTRTGPLGPSQESSCGANAPFFLTSEQGGKGQEILIVFGGRRSTTGSRLKQAGHGLHRGTTASVPGSLPSLAYLTPSREQVCMTKSCIAAQVFAGQEQKVRLINHNHTHLWPPRTEKHLQMVHKHKLPHIPSAWVREQVLLSQWHSAPQMEIKIITEFWNKGLQLLETALTGFTEHHSSKEEITTLSCASHVLHPLPAFPPWWYIHYGLTKVSLSDTSSLSHQPQKNLTEVQLHLCVYPALGFPPPPESGNGWYSHRRRISDLSGW